MSMPLSILLGMVLGIAANKILNATDRNILVDMGVCMLGAAIGGWLFDTYVVTGICAVVVLAVYNAIAHRIQ